MVGAIIVKNNKIIGQGYHRQYGQAHAEIEALKSVTLDVAGDTMYVTLEPCSMCLTALSNARIKRIYYGAVDKKFGAIEGAVNLFSLMPSLYKVECYGGFLEEESIALLKEFFQKLRG